MSSSNRKQAKKTKVEKLADLGEKEHDQPDADESSSADISLVRDQLGMQLSDEHLPSEAVGLRIPSRSLYDLLENSISHKQSFSAMLVGFRGSGKTLILRTVLKQLYKAHPDKFKEIHINGLIYPDDHTALNEILSQLADDEHTRARLAKVPDAVAAIAELIQSQKKPVFIFIDEADVFAHKNRQILLYTLLDMIHHEKVQIVVVFITCRVDLASMFEKRVQSRFSQRRIDVWGISDPLHMVQICKSALLLPSKFKSTHTKRWNERVTEVFEDLEVKRRITAQFQYCRDVRYFFSLLFPLVARISDEQPLLDRSDLVEALSHSEQNRDSKAAFLLSLSYLELCMLVAMSKLVKRGLEPFNFEMVWQEYSIYAKNDLVHQFTKQVCLQSFESLIELEFVKFHGSFNATPKEFRSAQLMVSPSQIERACTQENPECTTTLLAWANKWLE